MADRTPLVDPGADLKTVNQRIATTTQQLGSFNDPTSYISLLQKVGDASYAQNADIINYRQAIRSKLYGEQGYTPENMNLLTPEQQNSIRTSGRAELIAGLQAANETEAARGTRMETLLGTEEKRYTNQRQSLLDQLKTDTARRSELENNVEVREGYGELVAFNKQTGAVLYRIKIPTAPRSDGNTGTGKILDKVRAAGFDVRRQEPITESGPGAGKQGPTRGAFNDGGVDYFGPGGKKISRETFQNQLLEKGISVNPMELAQDMGSTNAQDWAGSVQGDRLTPDPVDQTSSVWQWLASDEAAGMTRSEIQKELKSNGFNPKDYGY